MVERKHNYLRSFFEKQISNFKYYSEKLTRSCSEDLKATNYKKQTNHSGRDSCAARTVPAHDFNIMTRKTRTRQPRIQSIQSGYCALCHIPYISVEEHIQSKRHQKLIGEDANYIALNSFESLDTIFTNLNGIDAVAVNDLDLSPKAVLKRRNMPRNTRTRILRSPNRTRRKDTGDSNKFNNVDCWSSGRPKRRSCIKQKRFSADERLVADNKTYYKVEVLPSKLRTREELKRPASPKHDNEDNSATNKVKKMRSSELIQLNTEATNFLFPKKNESSSEDDEENEEVAGKRKVNGNDYKKPIKMEEDSMDSTGSGGRNRKKRRTQAEAFILDNQKYYKFETPSSSSCRLRYHGSYLPPSGTTTASSGDLPKPPKNGDLVNKSESNEEEVDEKSEEEKYEDDDEDDEDEEAYGIDYGFSLENFEFSFESVPKNESWFKTFERQDKGEVSYTSCNDDSIFESFILPYQLGPLRPLDPQICIARYQQLMKSISQQAESNANASESCTSTSDASTSLTPFIENFLDEDSKTSATSTTTSDDLDKCLPVKKRKMRQKVKVPLSPSRNPRKSPRQHASTLAILSSLIQQRKRKSRSGEFNKLPTIPEEPQSKKQPQKPLRRIRCKKLRTLKKMHQLQQEQQKRKKEQENVDLSYIERELERILANSSDEKLDDFLTGDGIEFNSNPVNVGDILTMYDEEIKDAAVGMRRFLINSPGRKPARKKKKNKTGWPNRSNNNRRLFTASAQKDAQKDQTEGNGEQQEVVGKKRRQEEKEVEEEVQAVENDSLAETNCCEEQDRVTSDSDKVLTAKVNNHTNSNGHHSEDSSSSDMQPIVFVHKLEMAKKALVNDVDATRTNNNSVVPQQQQSQKRKRTNKRQSVRRRMPGSPKSPRMLRKIRGRWYRDR